ncbi:HNH endonuclease signature motif containing protein [Kytococcus sp. HMSC28H12]|uniref:HNH endonuclease signature motif containing protein n=1 Tax=Kytococcus sp. HMSC28H12 TaxID=1581067 RepID=UPI0008A19FDC|nr:HNH endonuclease signature motif containing protein [Kytococcus sp. HMSC28H12]OFS13004.1 hypothetical protein HMPREF3099_06835 [Kytococcus sp. HMSC28H12]
MATPIELAGPAPLEALEAAFEAARTADEAVMRALAELGTTGVDLERAQLAWVVEQSTVLANRGDRIRTRSMDVVRGARESGRSVHTDDGQFAGRAAQRDARDASRDRKLAHALGNAMPGGPLPHPGAGLVPVQSPGVHGAGATPDRSAAVPGPTDAAPAARYPLLADAFDQGLLSHRHAVIVVDALDGLPEGTPEADMARLEAHLVALAQRRSPSRLRVEARRAPEVLGIDVRRVDEHENTQVLAEETAALDAASFWMKDNQDGTWFGQFVLPELQAHMLKKALECLASPRRRNRPQSATGGAATSAASGSTGDGGSRHRELERRNEQGRALAELVDHLPTDHLGTKTNAILLVRTDLETLRGETDRAGVTESGAVVSAEQVRRLASQAGIVPAVMGGAGQLTDLGQQRRFFSEVQRSALALKYSHCAEEDCDRPFAWTEIHHADPWAPVRGPSGQVLHPGGGPTDLANGIPLCGRHHRLLDDRRRTHTIERDEHGVATVRFAWRTEGSTW